ncbi:hypothetical protein TNCT_242251 [Trichonephila clavata]|uniref:Uncharacterized protein n=1 Tax=Trichonephila clavata TaxID=2740835 RepID=A0A8X6EYM0_TRICU|nr:hypothetical protein TNCT_242251 [Trichonephila clavata]
MTREIQTSRSPGSKYRARAWKRIGIPATGTLKIKSRDDGLLSRTPRLSPCESWEATPSGFLDSTLRPTSSPVKAPSPFDATFTISTVKLSKFQQEWIKRCSEATPNSLDELALSLAGSVLKRPHSSRHARGRRDRRRPTQQPSTPAVESTTPHSNISSLRYDPAEASKIQRAFKVSPKNTLDPIFGEDGPFCTSIQEQIMAHLSEVFSKRVSLINSGSQSRFFSTPWYSQLSGCQV